MRIDARPFLPFVSANGGTARASRPDFNKADLTATRADNGALVRTEVTHTVTVYNPVPPDVAENTIVTIDGEKYRVVKGGLDRQPHGVILYLAKEGPQGGLPYARRSP